MTLSILTQNKGLFVTLGINVTQRNSFREPLCRGFRFYLIVMLNVMVSPYQLNVVGKTRAQCYKCL
jgi:hypothetical protein